MSSAAASPSSSSAGPPSSSNPPPPPQQQQIRPEMVNAAKQFMANPRVKQTPVGEQKQFLRAKGLTEAEIETALGEIGGVQQLMQQPSYNGQIPLPVNSSSRGNMIVDFAKTALVLGSTGYMFYQFVRSWLLPNLVGMPDPAEERMQRVEEQIDRMDTSNRAIAETVAQTLATVTEQNEQISRTLLLIQGQAHHKGVDQDRLLSELGVLKSLLLNQNQFPPIPQSALANPRQNGGVGQSTSGATMLPKIPAWQLASENGGAATNGHARHHKGEEDGEEGDELNTSNGSEI